ncbi:MAG: M50 family metallopeptidase [Planctomycetota bacterium]
MDDELELTAYHEAGHAVAAAILGGRVTRITLEPEDDDRYGDTRIEWPLAGVSRKEQIVREIRTLLAGPVAESIYAGSDYELRITRESSVDWLRAAEFASSLFTDKPKRTAYLAIIADELKEDLRQESIWAALAALSDELLAHETIEQHQIEEVLGFWLSR